MEVRPRHGSGRSEQTRLPRPAPESGHEPRAEALHQLAEHPVFFHPLADLLDRVEDRGVVAVPEEPADLLE